MISQMQKMAAAIGVVLLVASWSVWTQTPSRAQGLSPVAEGEAFKCDVTKPNGRYIADSSVPGRASAFYGNDAVAVVLWPEGTITFRPGGPGFVLSDSSLQMKFLWAKARYPMSIEGRRLDATAPPLRSDIDHHFDDENFQPSMLIFPSPGCWEVTSRVRQSSLTFVTRVVQVGRGPSRLP